MGASQMRGSAGCVYLQVQVLASRLYRSSHAKHPIFNVLAVIFSKYFWSSATYVRRRSRRRRWGHRGHWPCRLCRVPELDTWQEPTAARHNSTIEAAWDNLALAWWHIRGLVLAPSSPTTARRRKMEDGKSVERQRSA